MPIRFVFEVEKIVKAVEESEKTAVFDLGDDGEESKQSENTAVDLEEFSVFGEGELPLLAESIGQIMDFAIDGVEEKNKSESEDEIINLLIKELFDHLHDFLVQRAGFSVDNANPFLLPMKNMALIAGTEETLAKTAETTEESKNTQEKIETIGNKARLRIKLQFRSDLKKNIDDVFKGEHFLANQKQLPQDSQKLYAQMCAEYNQMFLPLAIVISEETTTAFAKFVVLLKLMQKFNSIAPDKLTAAAVGLAFTDILNNHSSTYIQERQEKKQHSKTDAPKTYSGTVSKKSTLAVAKHTANKTKKSGASSGYAVIYRDDEWGEEDVRSSNKELYLKQEILEQKLLEYVCQESLKSASVSRDVRKIDNDPNKTGVTFLHLDDALDDPQTQQQDRMDVNHVSVSLSLEEGGPIITDDSSSAANDQNVIEGNNQEEQKKSTLKPASPILPMYSAEQAKAQVKDFIKKIIENPNIEAIISGILKSTNEPKMS